MNMEINVLAFLMEHDVDLVSNTTHRIMSADCMYELEGELTVYPRGSSKEIYRGDDFEEALKYLEGKEE